MIVTAYLRMVWVGNPSPNRKKLTMVLIMHLNMMTNLPVSAAMSCFYTIGIGNSLLYSVVLSFYILRWLPFPIQQLNSLEIKRQQAVIALLYLLTCLKSNSVFHQLRSIHRYLELNNIFHFLVERKSFTSRKKTFH